MFYHSMRLYFICLVYHFVPSSGRVKSHLLLVNMMCYPYITNMNDRKIVSELKVQHINGLYNISDYVDATVIHFLMLRD